jgi:hypothetical protein
MSEYLFDPRKSRGICPTLEQWQAAYIDNAPACHHPNRPQAPDDSATELAISFIAAEATANLATELELLTLDTD